MTTREAHGQPQVPGETTSGTTSSVVVSAVVGSILGGIFGGIALFTLTTFHLPFMASLVGVGATSGIVGVWLGAALGMGLLFGSLAEPATEYYETATTWLTERLESARKLRDAIPVGSPTGVGLLYGLLMGDLVGLIGVPLAVGGNVPPGEAGPIVAGYAIYGLFLGFGYERVRAGSIQFPSVDILSPTIRGAIVAPLVAGALSGAIVYAGEPIYLRYLATIAGYASPTEGFAIWMVITVLLGLLFAAMASRHADRGNSTTGYGFVYGIVAAVFVGLLGIPALVSAATQWSLDFGDVGGVTLAAFVVYGLALGSVFGKTVSSQPLRPAFLVGRTRASVIAALVAGGISGGLLYASAPVALVLIGFLPGIGTLTGGFATWVGIAVLLGLGFAAFPARRVERTDYPGQTGVKLGLAYGLLVCLPVGLIVVPRVVDAVTFGVTMAPLTQVTVLGAYVVLGVIQGLTYGAIKGSGRLTPAFLQHRGRPLLGGVAVGAVAGAAVAYLTSAVPGIYLQILGGAIGVPSIAGGLAVWFGIALLCGLLFVPVAARVVEVDPGIVRGLVVGGVFGAVVAAVVGVLGVPAVTAIEPPHTNLPVVGYFVFGLLFGGVYGVICERTSVTRDAPTSTAVATRGQRAILFGSLFGGSAGGLIVYHMAAPNAMLYLSWLVGVGNYAVGWAVWLVLALVMGIAFGAVIGPRIDDYSSSFAEFVERDEDLDAVVGGFFDSAPITTTATIAGFVFGIVAAVAVGAIGFPLIVNTATQWRLPMPTLQPYFLLAFVVYGLVTGLGYGVVEEF